MLTSDQQSFAIKPFPMTLSSGSRSCGAESLQISSKVEGSVIVVLSHCVSRSLLTYHTECKM